MPRNPRSETHLPPVEPESREEALELAVAHIYAAKPFIEGRLVAATAPDTARRDLDAAIAYVEWARRISGNDSPSDEERGRAAVRDFVRDLPRGTLTDEERAQFAPALERNEAIAMLDRLSEEVAEAAHDIPSCGGRERVCAVVDEIDQWLADHGHAPGSARLRAIRERRAANLRSNEAIPHPIGSRVMYQGREGEVVDLQASSQIDTDGVPRGRRVQFADGTKLVHVDDLTAWPKGDANPRSEEASLSSSAGEKGGESP